MANQLPVVTVSDKSAARGQVLSASSLFSVSDADGDAITMYEFWDGTSDAASGHFTVNGVVQGANAVIDVTAAQLSSTTFTAGMVNDHLYVRAFDGTDWSEVAPNWNNFNVIVPPNHLPAVTVADVAAAKGQVFAASSLFSVSDADGDAITAYQFWDGTPDAGSGHFTVNGVVQAANTAIDVTAAQLASTTFTAGTSVNDHLYVRAFDGIAWSQEAPNWNNFNVTVPVNHLPVVTTANVPASGGQVFAASSLFSVSDSDGDAITAYQFWDGTPDGMSGYFTVNGVVQSANAAIDVSAAQLANTTFTAGMISDHLYVRAFDGTSWSQEAPNWNNFNVVVPNHVPNVTAGFLKVSPNATVQATSAFSASDPDGNPIVQYQFQDLTGAAGSGYISVSGTAQAANTLITVAASNLSNVALHGGSNPGADAMQVRAFDSLGGVSNWGDINFITNHLPVVTVSDMAVAKGQVLTGSSLFSVSDADGDTITMYEFFDGTPDAASGHFTVNGVAQGANAVIDVSAAQLANTTFTAGTVNDHLYVRAFDGTDWSAIAPNWNSFNVTVPVNHLPVVTVSDKAVARGQILSGSSLFSVSDVDGDAITAYQFWDGTPDGPSGHFTVNGVVQSANAVIDVSAAQLASTTFTAGTVNDHLYVRAFDGTAWSQEAPNWNNFNVTVPPNHLPVVTVADVPAISGQTFAASSLFSVGDADGDAITAYQFWDGTPDGASGHFTVNGVVQGSGVAIDVTAAQLSSTTFTAGTVNDHLYVRAFDGTSWSEEAPSWNNFNVVMDTAGNSAGAARAVSLGSVASPTNVNEFVGGADTSDYYSFTLPSTQNVHLNLGGLSGDLTLQLQNANGTSTLATSNQSGTAAETINQTLSAGTYIALVTPVGGAQSNYTLALSQG